MRSRQRIRKTAKWGGATLTVLCAIAWIFGTCWYAWVNTTGTISRPGNTMFVRNGLIGFDWDTRVPASLGCRYPLGPNYYSWRFHWGADAGYSRMILIPLWFPTSLALFITIIACRLDTLARRRPDLRCRRCAYDLTGLQPSSPCPECGTASQAPRLARAA